MKTTNQIYQDSKGCYRLREWYVKEGRQVMRDTAIRPDDPEIRPDRETCLWQLGAPKEPKAGTRTPASQFLVDGLR